MLGRAARTACATGHKVLDSSSGAKFGLWSLPHSLDIQACLHSTPPSFANPDNKPAPPGKEKNDPTNVKYDTPTKDPDDTSDYAPGYYDDKGKGGRQEVASGSSRVNPQDQSKHSHQDPVKTDKYKVEEHGDPARGSPADDNTDLTTKAVADSEDSQAGSGFDPNRDPPVGRRGKGKMPDQGTQSAGMPEPNAPPQKQEAGGYNPPERGVEAPASDILEKGEVKPGKPAPARPDEPHKYKYQ